MFDDCLYFNTAALARCLEREWALAVAPLGLTAPQAFTLRAVLSQPGLLQSELAQVLLIARPTATRALDALVAKGLVVRRATARDGREVAIHPTPEAHGLKAALLAAVSSVTSGLQCRLGDEGLAQATQRVRALRSALA